MCVCVCVCVCARADTVHPAQFARIESLMTVSLGECMWLPRCLLRIRAWVGNLVWPDACDARCVRACVRACVHVCLSVCLRVCMYVYADKVHAVYFIRI